MILFVSGAMMGVIIGIWLGFYVFALAITRRKRP